MERIRLNELIKPNGFFEIPIFMTFHKTELPNDGLFFLQWKIKLFVGILTYICQILFDWGSKLHVERIRICSTWYGFLVTLVKVVN